MSGIILSDEDKHKASEDQDFVTGEGSISGSNADLESDDDVLETAHEAGLYQSADDEHPQELNIAEQVQNAETNQREE